MEQYNINNYIFDKPLTSDNSGFAKWGLGKRGGSTFFVKEFLSPTYPLDSSIYTEEQRQDRIRLCDEFVQEKVKLYSAIRMASDGNLTVVEQFFRSGAKFYISTKAIQQPSLSLEDIARRPFHDRLRLCCSVAHSMMWLHAQEIVHADVKHDNILVVMNNGVPQAKIIDFDCSFFESCAPKLGEELNGDLVYLSPEGFLHIAGIESNIGCKMDIFALGILFHQYFTGRLPGIDTNEYQYVYEAVLDDQLPDLHLIENETCRNIVAAMLSKTPETRPGLQEVFQVLNNILLGVLGRIPGTEEPYVNSQLFYSPDSL